MSKESTIPQETWRVMEHPGYLGSSKDKKIEKWNKMYGKDNWRLLWRTTEGKVLDFDEVFQVYVEGYRSYFENHPDEAETIINKYSYGFDKDVIAKHEAFDPYALYNKPGIVNQFHHVAFNIGVEAATGKKFQGDLPVKVREGKPGIREDEQPEGYLWSPGKIPCTTPELIPDIEFINPWWQKGSIEDFYQSTKVLQIKVA